MALRRRIPVRWLLFSLVAVLALLPAEPWSARLIGPPATKVNAQPAPSGAGRAYPLNHTFDATGGPAGTPPANHDFEAAGTAVGMPPANHDFAGVPTDAGAPLNAGFETDFADWTVAGSPVIQTDATRGKVAKLAGSGAVITSSPFAVAADAQAFTFDIGYGSVSNSGLKVYALTGPTFATSTLLDSFLCSGCNRWETATVPAAAYRGQTIKLRFERYLNDISVDGPRARVLLPGWEASGEFTRETEAGGNSYAALNGGSGAALTSAAFTVDGSAQFVTFRVKGLTTSSDQYEAYVLSGAGFATATKVTTAYADDTWTAVRINVSAWAGQQVKLKLTRLVSKVGFDDAGPQRVDIPNWAVTKLPAVVAGGPAGSYLSTNGQATSVAFTLSADAQQLGVSFKGEGTGPSFYLELLRGADFSQVVDLGGGTISADVTKWQTVKAAVSAYAGETVKLRLRVWFATVLFDTAGLTESAVPGWTLSGTGGVTAGTDARGSYVAASALSAMLVSSPMSSGVLDRPGKTDSRRVAVAYDIGERSGSLLRVRWTNTATGQSWDVLTTASDTPTGYTVKYFPLWDFQGPEGKLSVQVMGGKVYAIADNLARQQLAEPYSRKVGLAIDSSTGAFGYAARDLATEGSLPLVLTRHYNADSDRVGPLGVRWTHSFEARLEIQPNGDAGAVFGDGREAFFDWQTSSFVATDPRVRDVLVKNGDGTYALTTVANLTYRFATDGRLTAVDDAAGNRLAVAYDGQGRPASVTGPGGGALTFAYDANGRLTSVTDPTNATVTYGYDAAGDLVSATDAAGRAERYTYDRHRLTRITDRAGGTLVANTLDSTGRVTRQEDAQAKALTLAYDTPGAGATRVTDPAGGVTVFSYDGFHRTTAVTDPTGRTESYAYDQDGNLFRTTDPAAHRWEANFDAAGNPVSVTDPLAGALQMTWDAQHRPTSVRDRRGNVTTLIYDAAGNVTQKTDATGQVWLYSYDARGNRTAETNPLGQTTTSTWDTGNRETSRTDATGRTWRWTYDAAGRMLSETDSGGGVTRREYDVLGRLTAVVAPDGGRTSYTYDFLGAITAATNPDGGVSRYTYDSRGLNVSETDPAGHTTTYAWDSARRLVSVTDPLGRATRYSYDAASRLASVTAPDGSTTYTYDTAGRLASERDALGRTTSYTYDAAGRVTAMSSPAGTFNFGYDADGNRTAATDPGGRTTTTVYDAVGRPTRVTDPLGRATIHRYDGAGRRTGVTDPAGLTTTWTLDGAGRVTAVTNPAGHSTSTTYDSAGRRAAVTDPMGRATSYTYDAAGRVTDVTTPAGTTTTAYDAAGRPVRVSRPSGAATVTAYDARGLVTSVTDPLGRVTSYAYDAAGQLAAETDPAGATTAYSYDAAGRLTSLRDALGGTVSYAYDAGGRQTAVTNARGKVTRFTYDALDNLLTETDPLGRTTTHSYDAIGRLASTTDPRGVTATYSYDAANQLTAVSYPGGTISYSYDLSGRRTRMVDGTGSTDWAYDPTGRVTEMRSVAGTVSYTYDASGRRTAMTLPGGRTAAYSYDTAGRLAALTDWAGRSTVFSYDADGRRTRVVRPNGVTTTSTYDAAGQLTGVAHIQGGTTLQSFAYTYDAAGNRTSASGPAGTETYTLDRLGRLTAVTAAGGAVTSYTYDAHGNRLTKTAGGQTSTYQYDDADQLIAEGTVTYAYDGAGNLTARGGDAFTWDWANRLASATIGGQTTTYAYDGDGVRVRRERAGQAAVVYLWDRESGLPLLVDDGANGYLHADGPLAEVPPSGSPAYPLGDALGSTRGVTDGTGALVGTADYDPFGAATGTSGRAAAFGFTGEQADPETGFLHLRARQYDPGTGRFLSRDSVIPNSPGSQGYHPYAYVANHPTTWVDPSGHLASTPAPVSAPAPTAAPARPASSRAQTWLDVELIVLAAAYHARVLGACLRTAWCAPMLAGGVGLVLTGKPLYQPAGVFVTTAAVIVCAMDIETRDGPGPAGVHVSGGDHCFEQFAQPIKQINNCAGIPARQCVGSGPGPIADEFPETKTGCQHGPGARCPGVTVVEPKDELCDRLGHWREKVESMSPRSKAYQDRITGHPGFAGRISFAAYDVRESGNPVDFDGCRDGVLLEAKGCEYAFLSSQPWYTKTEKDTDRVKQQAETARRLGVVMELHVAEAEGRKWFADVLREAGYPEVQVIHTPAVPPC